MDIVWKGKYLGEDQLERGKLPPEAVKFREPDNLLKMIVVALLLVAPVVFLIISGAIWLKVAVDPGLTSTGELSMNIHISSILLVLAMIIPHEILHAAAYPRGAEVQIWYSLKHLTIFVYSTFPLSKYRFILMNLFPNIILGFIPLIAWIFLPHDHSLSSILYSYTVLALLMGSGDYLNAFNAARQMPKGAYTQLHGFNSYWYNPDGQGS